MLKAQYKGLVGESPIAISIGMDWLFCDGGGLETRGGMSIRSFMYGFMSCDEWKGDDFGLSCEGVENYDNDASLVEGVFRGAFGGDGKCGILVGVVSWHHHHLWWDQ